MNLQLTLKRLWRRWYILVPGLVLAAALAFGAWRLIPPKYERTATQLLLPGNRSLPENANPYYYLGGLSQAADVLVRAVGSDNVLNAIEREHPGASVQVSRDPSTSGPVIYIVVSARSDEEAAAVMTSLVETTARELASLQDDNRAARADRITVVPVSVDQSSTLRQREKSVVTVGVFGAICALTILIAAVVEGLSIRAAGRAGTGGARSSPGAHRRGNPRPGYASRRTAGRGSRPGASRRSAGARRQRARHADMSAVVSSVDEEGTEPSQPARALSRA